MGLEEQRRQLGERDAKDIGDFTRISIIEPGHDDAGTPRRRQSVPASDKSPILYKTDDYGKTWTKIVNGIAPDHFLRVVREDPGPPRPALRRHRARRPRLVRRRAQLGPL
ncbi:MAG: hypothetical protein IPK33_33120 [Gemmatimonadetes bacterium]|nr:hypothetical protein [Gemmatimonadota bacterium]